jgi:hypothetical protein
MAAPLCGGSAAISFTYPHRIGELPLSMARRIRTQRTTRAAPAVKRSSAPKPSASTPWPTIEAFLENEDGEISLGAIGYNPFLGYTAVASDEHNMLVALVRRPGESL